MKKIKIDDDIWIGANSVIMGNIGRGSVVGAGSVVNKNIEEYSICAGNPVKIVGRRK
jgi:maltose O-acetyltransferase